ncbi:glutamate receptor ionotropic, kainate 5-like isoform X3 [Megalobrama amblycephala]|uniref:glutamate receptor ionotropic, kainate 5-like isoform X3 n=1 Tax=Megalobrama amblycephala TaxID=75352 RepID=UPI0020144DF4|nr:glutamate receptor ionotropic, kainate 5-like isoform X3 [Megalobrama amblycephala]
MPELPALLLSIYFRFLLVTVVTMPPSSLSQTPVLSSVRMAAILDDSSVCGRGERLALALARENINSVMEGPARARVEVDIFELQKDSQYETTDTMCQILPKGVVSVIGPASSPASGSIVSHICGEKEIPHVKIGPEETPRLPYLRFASVTLYPSNEDLSLAIGAILRSFSYPSASLVCAKAECLLRLEELIRRFLISRETLSIRMLDDNLDPTPLLKEIRDDKIATIIIDANASISYLILKKASELGMTSAFYKYILTTMDFPLLWLDDIVDEQSNIVGFSMFNTTHPFYLEFIRSLNLSWREGCDINPYPGPALSSALLFDAVHVVVSAVQELNRSQEIGIKPLSCTSPQIWQHGTSLMNYLRMVEYDGLTGRVEFNSKGQRTNYTLHILEKHRGGHKEIGIWYSNNTLLMNSTSLDINVSETLANKSLIITTILGRKPGYFSFLDPFSPAVWLFMLLAYLAVSCVLFLSARLSPYEWYNPHPCLRERRDLLENQYTLGNSLWFPIGGFMQQGSEIMPRALSTRCVSGVWWAFTLIIISSYTANLAAFLTVQRMEVPIESPDDLADQTNIQYGTIHGGSTMTFFMNSRYQTYQRMWNYMYSKQPSVFVKSTEEGIARVLNSKYAFLLESTMNEYHRSLNCNLTQIGGLLDTKGYGIGMPLGSPFRDEISLAVLQLQENNRLEILKRRWWEGGQCPKEEDHRAKGLGMENIGGIFVVLICGLIIAVFVAVMEFVWSTRRSAETDEVRPLSCDRQYHSHTTVSVCQEMLTEFRNAVSCKKSSRLRRRRPLSSSLALRHPTRITLGAPRPLRLVREMRLSNGKLYSGTGPLTGSSGSGGGPSDMGPGPQRLLEDPLGANSTPAVALGPPAVTVPLPRGCTHVRICQECRRIQSLRTTSCTRIPPSSAPLPRLAPPPPHSSSNTDSEGGGGLSPCRIGQSPPAKGCTLPPPQSSNNTDLMGEQK